MKEKIKHGHLTIHYDRFKDLTSIRLESEPMASFKDTWFTDLYVGIGAVYVHSGRTRSELREDDEVVLVFESNATNWRFLGRDKTVTALVDGRPIDCGQMQMADARLVYRGLLAGYGVKETLFLPLKASVFRQLITAHVLEFQLGDYELKLSDKRLQALREFAAYLRL